MKRCLTLLACCLFPALTFAAGGGGAAGFPAGGKAASVAPSVGAVQGEGGTNEGGSESVQSDEFTGAATFAVPLKVPPGRAGLEPRLLLNYHSYRKNPNSWVGLGWELEFGAITRAAERGAPNFVDGTDFEFHFAGQAETLVLMETGVDPASYGVAVTPGVTVDRYAAKIESAFNIFLHLRNTSLPNTIFDHGWIVIDKSGRRYSLGAAQNSRDQQNTLLGAQEHVARWLLDRVTDANGNQLTIEYGDDLLPSTIHYSDIVLTFGKTVDDDVHYYPTFRQGFLRREQVARLRDIIVNQSNGGALTRLQRITFNYTAGVTNAAPLLASVQRFGTTDAAALPAMTFAYHNDGTLTWDAASYTQTPASATSGTDTNNGMPGTYASLVDMNGDGLVDQVLGFPTSGILQVRLGNKEALGGATPWSDPFNSCKKTSPPPFTDQPCSGMVSGAVADHQWLFLMDMNGDGLPDRVARSFQDNNYNANQAYFAIAFNTGTGWQSSLALWKDPFIGAHPGMLDRNKGLIDMNGDGLVDRVIGDASQQGFRVYYNTGAGFQNTYTLWKDPIAVGNPLNPAMARLREWNTNENDVNATQLFVDIRDINGDGLPDRIYRTTIYTTTDQGALGFAVSLNLNGTGWAQPTLGTPDVCANNGPCMLFNSSDTLGMVDPAQNEDSRGYLGDDTHDLIDFNNDGYLDRVEGDLASGEFRIYFYAGLRPQDAAAHFRSTPLVMPDPVTNGDARGYITHYVGPVSNAFFHDMNGDLYPDRVNTSVFINVAVANSYVIYPLHTNSVTFSDTPKAWTLAAVNQPIGALAATDNGQGVRTAIEYLPSSWPWQWPMATHRFLPTPLYLAHALYRADHSVPDSTVPEATRHPHMRWTKLHYEGGNLFVRYAHKTSTNLDDDTIAAPFVARFNGFQRVEKIHNPLPGETWIPFTQIDLFHQAIGDVGIDQQPPADFFDPDGYGHFALSGKLYESRLLENGAQRRVQRLTWSVNAAPKTTNYTSIDCVTVNCLPQLTTRTTTLTEASSGTQRVTKTNYTYDAFGNITQEKLFANNALALETVRTYAAPSAFSNALQLRDRVISAAQQYAATIYRTTTYGYDANGNPTSEAHFVNASGAQQETTTRMFNAVGNMISVTGSDGVTHNITYDADQLFPITDSVKLPSGTTLTTTRKFFRLSGAVQQTRDPHGVGTQTLFDDFGRPTEERVIGADDGYITARLYQYTYLSSAIDSAPNETLLKTTMWEGAPGFPQAFTTPALVTFTDGAGLTLQRCARSERFNVRLTQTRRENGGRRMLDTEPIFSAVCNFSPTLAGNVAHTTAEIDLNGRATLAAPPAGDANSPTAPIAIDYFTNTAGALVQHQKLPNNQERTEVYDPLGRLQSVMAGLGSKLEYAYNPVGDLLSVKLNGTLQMSAAYDLLGRKLTTTDADLGTWKYVYDGFGRLHSQTDSKNQKTMFTYDAIGRVTQKQFRTSAGSVEKTESYTYDASTDGENVLPGELFEVREQDGAGAEQRHSRFSYDPVYRRTAALQRFIPALGTLQQTMEYDYQGKITATTYPGNAQLFYHYNIVGGLAKLCATLNCTAADGEVYQTIDPATAYDAHGALLTETAGNGVATTYEYFPASHRLATLTVARGAQQYAQQTYTYDAQANPLSVNDPMQVTGTGAIPAASYDAINRLTNVAYADGSASAMTYNLDGNILTNSANFPNATYTYTAAHPHAVAKIGAQNFTYDAGGNMLTDGARTLAYNAQNQLTQVTMQNGTVVTFDYDYTGARERKHVVGKDVYGATVESTTYYLGDALEIHTPGMSVGGTKIDPQVVLHISSGGKRLASRSLGTVAQILAANAAAPEAIAQRAERITTRLLANFSSHDVRSRTQVAMRAAAVATTLRAGAATANAITAGISGHLPWLAFTIGLLLLMRAMSRCKQIRTRALLTVLLVMTFLPPHLALSGDAGTPLLPQDDVSFLIYYHADHLGSSHLITEGNAKGGLHAGITYPRGTVLQRFEYGAWGGERFALNPNLNFDPRFTGQEYDIDTGLYFFKARYYNPILARFLQPDTVLPNLADPQAYNRYSYVRNNPLKYIDPSGHAPGVINIVIDNAPEDEPPPPPAPTTDATDSVPDGHDNLISATTNTAQNSYLGALTSGAYPMTGPFNYVSSYAWLNPTLGLENDLLNAAYGIVAAGLQALGLIDTAITAVTGCDAGCQMATSAALGPVGSIDYALGGLRAGLARLGQVGRLAASQPRPTIIIGEGMGRVQKFASELESLGVSARTYSARNISRLTNPNFYGSRKALDANWHWADYWARQKNAYVIDIGRQPGRTYPSPHYDMEFSNTQRWEQAGEIDPVIRIDPGY